MRLTIHSPELARVVDAVANDDPRLADVVLQADGRFQTRELRVSQLLREVEKTLEAAFRGWCDEDFPRLICGVGRARGGSTALTNVFGVAGFPAYYQPVKAILRHRLVGSDAGAWPAAQGDCIFAKETFGPYSLAECLFLPVDLLLRAGYPKERLHVVHFDREPLSALASWLGRWGHRLEEDVLLAHFVIASHNAKRVARRARASGLRVTHYIHELSKDPESSIARLFARTGESRRFTPTCVSDWGALGDLSENRSGVIFASEPEVFNVPGLHGADTAYRYRPRNVSAATSRHRELIESHGLDAMYRSTVRQSMLDLEYGPHTAARLLEESLQ